MPATYRRGVRDHGPPSARRMQRHCPCRRSRTPAKARMPASIHRVVLSDMKRSPIQVPTAAPSSAAGTRTAASGGTRCPEARTPTRPTTEFARMNGAETAAARFGDAQPRLISTGARKTPPPTPVSPDRKPAAAPGDPAREQPDGGAPARGIRIALIYPPPEPDQSRSGNQDDACQAQVEPVAEDEKAAEESGRERGQAHPPQQGPIDGATPVQPPGRVGGRGNVEDEGRWPHFVDRKGEERHDRQEGGAARLASRGIEKRGSGDERGGKDQVDHPSPYADIRCRVPPNAGRSAPRADMDEGDRARPTERSGRHLSHGGTQAPVIGTGQITQSCGRVTGEG